MDQASLAQLLEISLAIGSNSDYVQAGGGNTSVKSADGRTMAIKASGTPLAQMSETVGWADRRACRTFTTVIPDALARSACSGTLPRSR